MRGRGRAGGSTNSKEKAFRAPGEGVLPGPRPTEDTFIFFLGGLGPFNEPVFFFSPLSGPAVSLLSQPGPFPLPPCPPLPSLLLTHRETFPWKRSLGEGGRGGSSHGYMAVGERRKKKKKPTRQPGKQRQKGAVNSWETQAGFLKSRRKGSGGAGGAPCPPWGILSFQPGPAQLLRQLLSGAGPGSG